MGLRSFGLAEERQGGGRTHPDERVVDEVTGVAELASERRVAQDGVSSVEALNSCLSVLEGLADPHHWEVGGDISDRLGWGQASRSRTYACARDQGCS